MREKIRTLCALAGLAGAVVGRMAIICSTSLGHGTVGCWLRPPQGSFSPGVGAPATNSVAPPRPNPPPNPPVPGAGAAGGPSAALSAAESCSWETEPDFWVSAESYHAANAVFSSAAVTEPSLSPSKIVKSCGPMGDPPRPPPAGAGACTPAGGACAPIPIGAVPMTAAAPAHASARAADFH